MILEVSLIPRPILCFLMLHTEKTGGPSLVCEAKWDISWWWCGMRWMKGRSIKVNKTRLSLLYCKHAVWPDEGYRLSLVWQRYGHVCFHLRAVALTSTANFDPRGDLDLLSPSHDFAFQALLFLCMQHWKAGNGPGDKATSLRLHPTTQMKNILYSNCQPWHQAQL